MTAGKIERLPTRGGSPRTPERQRLAEAIARDVELENEISRASEALRRARELEASAENEISVLEQRLEEAKEGAPGRLVDALINNGATEDDSTTPIEAALAKARADLETRERAVTILSEQLDRLTHRRIFSSVGRALVAVINAEAFPAILARHEDLRRRLAESNAILGALRLQTNYDPATLRPIPDCSTAAADAWKAAVLMLARDADAALPKVERVIGDPPPRAA